MAIGGPRELSYLCHLSVQLTGELWALMAHGVLFCSVEIFCSFGSSDEVDHLVVAVIAKVNVVPALAVDELRPGFIRHVYREYMVV